MKSPLEQAVRFNNKGVSLLSAGCDRRAVQYLSRSLNLIRNEFDDAPSSMAWKASYVNLSSKPSTTPLENLQDSSFYIYNRAFKISPNFYRCPDMVPICSSCIVLNLALTYHRLGRQGFKGCLTKAERMYGMVARLLASSSDSFDSQCLRLVAINNMAQIQRHENRYQETNQAIHQLSMLIRHQQQRMVSQQQKDSDFFRDFDLQALRLNVVLYSPPVVASAA